MDNELYLDFRGWDNAFSSNGLPLEGDPIRGSWFLYVQQTEVEKIWGLIELKTESGRLGYKSSLSQTTMHGGDYEGYYTIACFTLHERRYKVAERLGKWGLGQYIDHYNFIKKFRKGEMSGFEEFGRQESRESRENDSDASVKSEAESDEVDN